MPRPHPAGLFHARSLPCCCNPLPVHPTPMHPDTPPNPDSIAGALWLNGLVWGTIVLGFLAARAESGGGYLSGLGPILFGWCVAGLGMLVNGVLAFSRLSTSRRQSLAYGIGCMLLAGVFFLVMNGLSHIGKIGG
jgi:hypothetical protein